MNIGVFDSGIGGLWILKHLQAELPGFNYLFLGDQVHVPYGPRPMSQIRDLSLAITKFLIEKDCKIIVIACNTASAASLKYLRDKFPSVLFVGMEPAVKPAVLITRSGKVGVLATPATFQGELYNSVVERFAHDVEIFKDVCPNLVNQIEALELDSPKTRIILEKALIPMIEKGIDTVVLGCTHYPFVIPQIKKIVGEKINIIDPTNAIVSRVSNLIKDNNLSELINEKGCIHIYTSGNTSNMGLIIKKIFDKNIDIQKIEWKDDFNLNVLK